MTAPPATMSATSAPRLPQLRALAGRDAGAATGTPDRRHGGPPDARAPGPQEPPLRAAAAPAEGAGGQRREGGHGDAVPADLGAAEQQRGEAGPPPAHAVAGHHAGG